MRSSFTRREFLHRTTLAAAGVSLLGYQAKARRLSPNEKLNIGIIGVAGQGEFSINNLTSQNIVALCDIDDRGKAVSTS